MLFCQSLCYFYPDKVAPFTPLQVAPFRQYNHSKHDFYTIRQELTPDQYRKLGGYKHNDYEAKFITPYGFSIILDTLQKTKIDVLKHWMAFSTTVGSSLFS